MNKINTIILSILGGVNVALDIAMPLIVMGLLVNTFAFGSWQTVTFMIVGALASIFRSIKIGWMK